MPSKNLGSRPIGEGTAELPAAVVERRQVVRRASDKIALLSPKREGLPQRLMSTIERGRGYIRDYPVVSVAMAFAAGYVLNTLAMHANPSSSSRRR